MNERVVDYRVVVNIEILQHNELGSTSIMHWMVVRPPKQFSRVTLLLRGGRLQYNVVH